MVSKISNNVLIIILAVLAVLMLLIYFTGGKSERSFHDTLVEIDTSAVNKIVLYPKSNNHKEVTLLKNDKNWRVKLDDKTAATAPNAVESMIAELLKMKPKKLASRKENKWAEYQVDTSGTRVKVFEDGDETADVIIGKIKFRQPRSVSTYIRLADETDVYEVDGFLEMTFNKDANGLRDSRIISSDNAKWQAISFDYPVKSSFSLLKVNDKWQSDQMLPDSAQTESTLRKLAHISGSAFADNIDKSMLTDQLFKLTIDVDSEESIVINGYNLQDKVIITSSLNPETYFVDSDGKMQEELLLKKEDFEKPE